jgi:hypothetical protein
MLFEVMSWEVMGDPQEPKGVMPAQSNDQWDIGVPLANRAERDAPISGATREAH